MKGLLVVVSGALWWWSWLLCCVGLLVPPGSSSLLTFENYPVSLYFRESRLSTVLWFRPPYCLYELWAAELRGSPPVTRQAATIEIQVKPAGDKGMYKATQRFPIPMCKPTKAQSLALGDHAYEVGPALACLNYSCIGAVLPGRKYSIRFVLCDQDQTVLAATGWSRHFRTRDMPHDFRTLDVDFGSHSTGMVVITVLVSTALFFLLGAAGLALIVRPP